MTSVTPQQIREDAKRLRKEAISLRLRGHVSVADALERSAACLLALADAVEDPEIVQTLSISRGDDERPATAFMTPAWPSRIARHLRTAEETD